MFFKLKTSKKTMDCFVTIGASENLQPFILSKLAISLSLCSSKKLDEKDFKTDTNGLELNRQTITGEYDLLFKCLIQLYENVHLADDVYFPKYMKAHIDRGSEMLLSEFRYGRNFYNTLLNIDKSL